MVNSDQIKLNQTLDRITEAIIQNKNLNTPNNLRFPCSICNKNVLDNQQAVLCETCDKWCHIKCDGTSREMYEYLQNTVDDEAVSWHCLNCTVKFHHQNLPFTLTDDSELDKINKSKYMRFCEFLPSLETISVTTNFSNFPHNEDDYTLPSYLNSKYYSVYNFQNLKIQKIFNIFHSNMNGLETKFDILHNFLSGSVSAFDILGITETSESDANSFTSNVSLDGYKPFYTPTNSRNGGTALYVKSNLDSFERTDFKSQTDLFESVWVEINNKRSKNIVCGCVYRHPNYQISDFLVYLDNVLQMLSKENKEIYICGDFNIDLLKIDDINSYLEFYNLLSSYSLLPLIIHPTRVVDGQEPSLIDNIFSNNVSDEIISGNIYLTLSEHFTQFASVKKEKIDTVKIDVYNRDFSKFSSIAFYEDVSIQAWNYNLDDSNKLMNDFVWRLDGCANRHAPIKNLMLRKLNLKLNLG